MNHSPSEIEALEASIEVVPRDSEFQKELIDSIEKGSTTPCHTPHAPLRRRITILNQGADYSVVFDQAQSVISNMRAAYEEMFENWKQESEMNSLLAKNIDNLKTTIEAQKKGSKKVLDEKSQLQEQLEKAERRPKLQSKVEELETELASLKIEIGELKRDRERQNTLMAEKTTTLEFYRKEFGVQKEEEEMVTFRPRLIPVRRTHSSPNNHRISKNVEGRKLSTGPSKLFGLIQRNCN